MPDELKVPFGKRPDGSIVHISEVSTAENGLSCGCFCPECGEPLSARNKGKIRSSHFAHRAACACSGGVETALHLFAKEVFLRHESFLVPSLTQHVGGRTAVVSREVDMPYVDVAIEQSMGSVKPDVFLKRPELPPMLVEIAVFHFVDDEKYDKLELLGHPCIEIDLRDLVSPDEFDRETLESALVKGAARKTWVFHPKADEVREGLLEAVRKEKEAEERQEREREAAIQRAKERTLAERARVTSPEYQQMMVKRTEAELPTHPIWVANRRAFGMADSDETPWYLNDEINGEYLWTVHRTVWQSALFRSWVFNKRDLERSRIVSVKYALKQLRDTHPEIWEECLYWAWKDDARAQSASDVVGEYFRTLARCGFLHGTGNWGPSYGWKFECVVPKFIAIPLEYNSPRYLPREGGVLDTESGRMISL